MLGQPTQLPHFNLMVCEDPLPNKVTFTGTGLGLCLCGCGGHRSACNRGKRGFCALLTGEAMGMCVIGFDSLRLTAAAW